MGRTWLITRDGMAGVAKGDPANVSVDLRGYLHLGIVNRHGVVTAAELFSTGNLGFGTYRWQIEGPIVPTSDQEVVIRNFQFVPLHATASSHP